MIETVYLIRNPESGPFKALVMEMNLHAAQVIFRRARSHDPWRDRHEFQGGYWYVHTDGKVDFIREGEGQFFGYGFEAVAPVKLIRVPRGDAGDHFNACYAPEAGVFDQCICDTGEDWFIEHDDQRIPVTTA